MAKGTLPYFLERGNRQTLYQSGAVYLLAACLNPI